MLRLNLENTRTLGRFLQAQGIIENEKPENPGRTSPTAMMRKQKTLKKGVSA
jgi:hypothetical protein